MTAELCLFLLQGATLYFLSINLIYGLLMLLSWLEIRKVNGLKKHIGKLPGVSFIVPAFNEESLIVETLQTYLSLSQEEKEVIVIDDGSHDKTMALLTNMYQLQKLQGNIYQSITHPHLKVLKAQHSGKAQALNIGIEHSKYAIICTMDADTVPTQKGVEASLAAFAEDPKLIAVGGVISPLQTSGKLNLFQRIEYLRAFVCERLGWSFLGSTVLISGAFCMVKKEALRSIGGFNPKSLTEDFDLIMRLRKSTPGNFKTIPEVTCYTQVPGNLKHLSSQRKRWHLGLVQTLGKNTSLFLNPSLGMTGLFTVPYFFLVEALSPLLELFALFAIPFAIFQGWLPLNQVLYFIGVGLIFNLFLTIIGARLDEKYISGEKQFGLFSLSFNYILFNLGYKQLNTLWRLIATMKVCGKRKSWGEKPRQEIA